MLGVAPSLTSDEVVSGPGPARRVGHRPAAVRGVASRPGLREGLTVERNRVRRARVVSGFIRGGAREQRLHHEENQVARRESGCGRRPLGRIWRGPARVPEWTWSRLIVRVEGSRQKTRRATEDLGPGFLP